MQRPIVPLVLVAAGLVSACAGESDTGDLEYRVSKLAAKVKRIEDDHRGVSRRLDAALLKITNLQQEMARLRQAAAGTPAAPGEKTDAPPAPEAAAASQGEIADYLKTEEGKKLLEESIAKAQLQRDAERRARGVRLGLSRFAEQAGLDDYQSRELTKILGKYMGRIREVWSKLRGSRDLTPEERSRVRQEIMASTQRLREEMDEEVKNLLTPEQYEAYKKQPVRSRGFRGPGGRRRDR